MYRRYYYLRRRKHFLKIAKEYRNKNRDKIKETCKKWRENNQEFIKELSRKYYYKNRNKILNQKRRQYRKLYGKSNVWWTKKQDNLLIKYYGILQARELIKKFRLLKNRSIRSIHYRAGELSLSSDLVGNPKNLNPMWNKHHKLETIKKIRKKAKERYKDLKIRLKISKINKELWKNPIYAKNQIKCLKLKPTLLEKQIIQINKLNNLPFKYIGDGKLWIEGKNPDFICNPTKKIIEANGEYWHRDKLKERRKKYIYKKYGFKTLIIWGKELKYPQKVTEKIINFLIL